MFLLDFACTRFIENMEKSLDITAFSLSLLIGNICTGSISLLIDDIEHQMYPIPSDVIHDYRCFIGRVRCFDEHTIGLWSVCDEIEMLSANGVMAAFIFVNNDWLRNE